MTVELFLAPAAGGKTAHAIERIRTLPPLSPVRVVVPDQMEAAAFRRRLAQAGGALGTEVQTFYKLYADVLTLAGGTAAPEAREEAMPRRCERQITGQPAGPGLARGTARIIRRHTDIAGFKKGEVIVCDAVDPNMTFVMPLAAAIIERRGGMLIHGAIIAREYGLPCVTGVAGATEKIQTGQRVTVDGYLGIVTLSNAELS